MKKLITSSLCAIVLFTQLPAVASEIFSADEKVTRQDKLRGSITPERQWWDLQHYHLELAVMPETKTISGINTMTYKVLSEGSRLQIELQPPMQLDKVEQDGKALSVEKDGYSYFITPKKSHQVGEEYQLKMHFSGEPHAAKRAPWDGGITWAKDKNDQHFIASSNQGIGASIWWPNKDHGYDEPDQGLLMSVEVPKPLTNVSNGRLVKVDEKESTRVFHWKVVNPINNYGVNINIGDYVHFGEKYQGEKGQLDMDYWVLSYNLEKAKEHFKDAKRTIEAFEHWFGPYPFYEDSFKLVEAPYLGMEHQSSVTYGNGYKKGYFGRDLSSTGQGLKFDFIIIHEAGHEWFANNITAKDIADLWVHESFTNYSEGLFVDYHYGKDAGAEYIRGSRQNVAHAGNVVGIHDIHREGSSDMYYKGGNMLHTIRQIINDDEKWREILRGLNKTFYHSTVDGEEIEAYISEQSGRDFSKVFDQYLRDTRLPVLEIFNKGDDVRVRWKQTVKGFDMPVKVYLNGKEQWLQPNDKWTKLSDTAAKNTLVVDKDFYIATVDLLGN